MLFYYKFPLFIIFSFHIRSHSFECYTVSFNASSSILVFLYFKISCRFTHLLGVDEAVAAAHIGYFYGAVSVGGEGG